ncbi:hypothetical protein L9F63_021925, partial [Diploptera punctata]
MESIQENCSFLNARAPSVFYGNKLYQAPRKNLCTLFDEEERNSIKVYLRIKPDLKPRILGPPQDELFTVKSPTQLVTKFSKDSVSHEFQFTKVFKSDSTQEDVYSQSVHGLMADFINGQNCLLFAYGTSSAGKTYTIQ